MARKWRMQPNGSEKQRGVWRSSARGEIQTPEGKWAPASQQLSSLPSHSTTRPLRQCALVRLQHKYGNFYVQRLLDRPGDEPAKNPVTGRRAARGEVNGVQARSKEDPIPFRLGASDSRSQIAVPHLALDRKRYLSQGAGERIQRKKDKGTDGSQYVELEIPDGSYVLEAVNVPATVGWSLKYSDYLDIYATASQYSPRKIDGLDASPHKLRDTRSGPNLNNFRVLPGKSLEPKAGQGSVKVQAFRHNVIWDDPTIEAYLWFDTVPLIASAGDTEFVSLNVPDMNPLHHDPITVGAEGTGVGKEVSSTIEVSDGVTFSASKTVTSKVAGELSRNLGLEIGLEGIGKLTGGASSKLAVERSISNTVSTSVSKQIKRNKTVKTSYRFDKPGHYAIYPTFKLYRTPVVINTFEAETGKFTGQKQGYVYTLIFNPTGSIGRVVGGKLVPLQGAGASAGTGEGG